MDQNKYLLKRLTLNNFMLHQNTSFQLDNSPITLLTGANGSGKTQVLDGLIMAFGHYPKRLKKSGINSAIGPFSETASITLELYLPKKFLKTMEVSKELKDILAKTKENFGVTTTIHSEGVDYFIDNSPRIKLKRKHVRQLFKHLSIKAENKLAFTEEGTVNIFTDHSSRNKLDLFLQTTGLTDYRDNIVQSLEATEKARNSIEPLKRKLSFENEYLNKMNETRHLISKKQALQEEHEKLLLEESWSKVQEKETEFNIIEEEYKHKTESFSFFTKSIKQATEHSNKLQKELHQKNRLLQKSKDFIEDKQSQTQRLGGQNESNTKILQDTKQKKQELVKQLNKVMSEKSQEKIEEIKQRMVEVEQEREKISSIRKVVGENFFGKSSTSDREYLSQALYLYELFKTKDIEIKGPLFLEIKTLQLQPEILWKLLGFYCFAFVAKTQKNYEAACIALDELKTTISPIVIAYNKSSEIASDCSLNTYLKTDPSIVSFLKDTLGITIGSTGLDATKIFKENKTAAITSVGNHVYHKNNMMSLGWYPQIINYCSGLSIKDLQKAIYANEIENKLAEEYNTLKISYEEVNAQKQIQYSEERIADLSLDIENIEREIDNISSQIYQAEKKLSAEQKIYNELLEKIEKEQQQEKNLNEEISKLSVQKEMTANNIHSLEAQLKEKQSALETLLEEAKAKGNRPLDIRQPETIIKKRLLIEGQLSSIEITPVSEEVYLEQKEKVQRLDQEVKGAAEHIENLQVDINKRFEAWHKDVADLLKAMSTSMNFLLSNIASEVRLRIENIKDPINAGMHIELKRHSKKWLDLSNLSGGEKVLTIEALILSMHLQTDSVVHAIDECTQRLDLKFKAMAFEMVQKAVENLQEKATGFYTPQFLLLAPDTLGITFDDEANKYFHRVVLAPAVSTN